MPELTTPDLGLTILGRAPGFFLDESEVLLVSGYCMFPETAYAGCVGLIGRKVRMNNGQTKAVL